MAEPSVSRASLRRSIGRLSRQEFFRKYAKNGYFKATTADTTEVADTVSLKQSDDYWQGQILYDATIEEERMITAFDAGAHKLIPEFEFSTGISSDDEFEIWSLWPPSAVHDAIDASIEEAWKIFPRTVTNERIIYQEDVTRYQFDSDSLNPFTDDTYPPIGILLSIWIEKSRNAITGMATGGDSTQIEDTDMDSPDTTADTDWFVSIYAGTGVGQLREVSSVDSDGIISLSEDLATNPDTTSEYALWDVAKGEQEDEWEKLTALNLDRLEYPDWMYLTKTYPEAEGMRFRLRYVAASPTLSADTDEVYIPREYIWYKALSILFASVTIDIGVDRSAYAGLSDYFGQKADKYAAEHGRPMPPMDLWMEEDVSGYTGAGDQIDPLGWRS